MSVSVFANTLRTHSRLRVLTATRVTLPTTRCIGSLVAFRTAIPKNVSFSVSRSFTISQVARNELEDGASSVAPGDMLSNTIFAGNVPWRATEEDLTKAFEKFGEIKAVRIRGFFFLDFFSTVFFLRTTFLDMYQRGNSRGTCFIDFANKNSVAATLKSVAQEPIELFGRQLRVHNPRIENRKYEPNKKLYFSGSAGDESEIRKIFKQFNDYIVTVSLCMLSIVSDSVPTTHMEQH